MHAWNNPLHHLVTELGTMKGAPDAILSRAKGIENLNSELLESIMVILSMVSSFLIQHFSRDDLASVGDGKFWHTSLYKNAI